MRLKEGPLSLKKMDLNFILRQELPQRLKEAADFVERGGWTETAAGKICLQFGLSQNLLLRQLLADPATLLGSDLMTEIPGGEDYNPCRRIDKIGGKAATKICQESGMAMDIFIEEPKRWQQTSLGNQDLNLVVVDPCDGTEEILVGKLIQTAGMIVADQKCNFLAGVAASLVDENLLLVEKNKARLFSFDGVHLRQQDFPRERLPVSVDEALIAILERRVNKASLQKNQDLFGIYRYGIDFPSFGGGVLLKMLQGEIDVALDPFKGQPWYEAVLWGWMGEKSGLVVTNEKGERIDFQQVLGKAYQVRNQKRVKMGRVPLVISREEGLHQAVLNQLNNVCSSMVPRAA